MGVYSVPRLSQNGLELDLNTEETSGLGCNNISHWLCECFSKSGSNHKWFSPYIFSKEHWREDQKVWMSGTPCPPRSFRVKMRDLGYLCLFSEIMEVMRFSSLRIHDLGGVGGQSQCGRILKGNLTLQCWLFHVGLTF